jgi:Fe-Mn family superoxide dismutase
MKLQDLYEAKQKLTQEQLPVSKDALDPVLSSDTLDYHYGSLARGYVDNYNAGVGDAEFNEAGAYLHNVYFTQFQEPAGSNAPHGAALEFINQHYGSYAEFQEQFKAVAMTLQGSAWVYLSKGGDIKTIPNHALRTDIILLVDWWEHAWALDYQSDKEKYLDNIWKIINWEIINTRLLA